VPARADEQRDELWVLVLVRRLDAKFLAVSHHADAIL